MIIATVKKSNGAYLDHGNFASQEAALAWFRPFIDKGVYGQKHIPAQYKQVEVELSPAVRDELGEVISPAVTAFQEVVVSEEIPAEFVIEFQDVASIPKTQAEINAEARAFLSNSDYKVIRHQDQLLANETPSLSEPELQTLLAQRKAARESIV